MRNMRSITIRIRGIVSGLDTLLLLLLDIGLGELDELLTFSVHPRVVLIILICGLLEFKKTLLTYSTFSFFSF
jgi:hypothetical protein